MKTWVLGRHILVAILTVATVAGCSGGKKKGSSSSTAPVTTTSTTTTTTTLPDTTAPNAPAISSPSSNPYTSGETTFSLQGTCEVGATVNIAGDLTDSSSCGSGTFQFTISKSADGVYQYQLTQTDTAANTSSATNFQWTRSATVAPPTVSLPATSPYRSNGSSIVISGTCTTGNTIVLTGDSSQSMVCASSAFSFTVNKSIDGTYNFSVRQDDTFGNSSAAVQKTWIRDATAPAAVVVTVPSSSTFTSADASFTLSGSCETGTTVALSGDDAQSMTCAASAFSFSISESSDGTYNYSLIQTDLATNASPTVSQTWVRDSSIPATPVMSSPTSANYYSSANSLNITGSCVTGNTVYLSGSESQTYVCAGSSFAFTVTASIDGTESYTIYQEDATTFTSSGEASLSWTRDTVAPAGLTKVNPASSPYTSASLTISGGCETGASVILSGDDSQTVTCSSGGYSFTILESTNATYNYSIVQKDLALNTSSAVTQQWIKDNSVPAAPTIVTPATNPYTSNVSPLNLSGACDTGYTVTLSGNVVASDTAGNSLTQTCSNAQYSFVISKTVDASYTLNVKQTSVAMIDSPLNTLQWIYDATVPDTTITAMPLDPNLGISAEFSFSSDDAAATFECQLDGGGYTVCTSPKIFTGLTNASHTFMVRAKDSANNVDATPATYTWTQSAGNTIALYHMDNGVDLVDDGSYTGLNENTLTNSSATLNQTGKFLEGILFSSGSSSFVSAPHTSSLAQMSAVMTAEAWVKLTSLPTGYMNIASKSGASGQYGWHFGIKKSGTKYKLYFFGSINGTAFATEVQGTNFTNAEKNALTSGFNHVAVTFNRGAVKLFLNGVAKGSGSIGTNVTLYNNSSTSLRLGRSESGEYLDGTLDEVRLSQIIRYPAAFTPSAVAFTAD